MIRFACIAVGLLGLTTSLGCALCSSPFDLDYVTFGGKTPRSDMRHGRIGSPLSDPAILQPNVEMVHEGQPTEIQPLESQYGDVLESTSQPDEANGFVDTGIEDEVVEIEQPILLEQRQPAKVTPSRKTKILRVPSGDSLFDDDF